MAVEPLAGTDPQGARVILQQAEVEHAIRPDEVECCIEHGQLYLLPLARTLARVEGRADDLSGIQ